MEVDTVIVPCEVPVQCYAIALLGMRYDPQALTTRLWELQNPEKDPVEIRCPTCGALKELAIDKTSVFDQLDENTGHCLGFHYIKRNTTEEEYLAYFYMKALPGQAYAPLWGNFEAVKKIMREKLEPLGLFDDSMFGIQFFIDVVYPESSEEG